MSSETLISIRLNADAREKLESIAHRCNTSMNGVLAAAAADLAGMEDPVPRRTSRAMTNRDPGGISNLTLRVSAAMLVALEARAARERLAVSAMIRDRALSL